MSFRKSFVKFSPQPGPPNPPFLPWHRRPLSARRRPPLLRHPPWSRPSHCRWGRRRSWARSSCRRSRLSRITFATPCLVHSFFSLPPMPWSRYRHGVLLVLGIAGRSVDFHPALDADRFGFVVDLFQLALFDSVANLVEALRRHRAVFLVAGPEPATSCRDQQGAQYMQPTNMAM